MSEICEIQEIYVFHDWTALSQVKNSVDPKRRAQASVSPSDGSITITILEDKEVLVRIKVDSVGVWSLTYEEAESLLNSYGFNCRFESTYQINDNARDFLESLRDAGFEFIVKTVKPVGSVFAVREDSRSLDLKSCPGWSYTDWLFMSPNVPYKIVSLLK